MGTAIGNALAEVGLVNQDDADKVECSAYYPSFYKHKIEEISRLCNLLEINKVKLTIVDTLAQLHWDFYLRIGQYDTAYGLMLTHLRKRVAELGLVQLK